MLISPVESPYLVPFDNRFRIEDYPTEPPDEFVNKSKNKKRLKKLVKQFNELQRKLYADDRFAVLLIFQAMDAAGKDGTIRAVTTGVNPAGFQVSSFKVPTPEELDHDFLWRTSRRLPERGRVGIFNRSYYEEVLVVRVHPEFLENQRLPPVNSLDELWANRFESIRAHEKHLAENGVLILKFWLNVSKEEQRQRFLARLKEPEKNWKFSEKDVQERQYWEKYMEAYQDALNATSRPWAPWYAIPADDKPYMRVIVAEIIVRSLERLGVHYPQMEEEDLAMFQQMERKLLEEM